MKYPQPKEETGTSIFILGLVAISLIMAGVGWVTNEGLYTAICLALYAVGLFALMKPIFDDERKRYRKADNDRQQ